MKSIKVFVSSVHYSIITRTAAHFVDTVHKSPLETLPQPKTAYRQSLSSNHNLSHIILRQLQLTLHFAGG